MSDNVIELRPKDEATKAAEKALDEYNKPQCVLNPDTGLYDVVFQGVTVFANLNVVRRREAIRQRAETESRFARGDKVLVKMFGTGSPGIVEKIYDDGELLIRSTDTGLPEWVPRIGRFEAKHVSPDTSPIPTEPK